MNPQSLDLTLFWTALASLIFVLGVFPRFRPFARRIPFFVLYVVSYAVLSWVGQSAESLESHLLPVGLAVAGGIVCVWTASRFEMTGSRTSQLVVVLGMLGLGLLTALFSGPQGSAGKFVYFLEHVLHLSEQAATVVNFLVRKGLHLSVYGSLSVSAGLVARKQGAEMSQVWMAGLLWGLVHAVCDELTQSKTSLRTGSPYDVVLDLSGMVVGLVILMMVVKRSQLGQEASAS